MSTFAYNQPEAIELDPADGKILRPLFGTQFEWMVRVMPYVMQLYGADVYQVAAWMKDEENPGNPLYGDSFEAVLAAAQEYQGHLNREMGTPYEINTNASIYA